MSNIDILNPDLIWIDGRCYRKLATYTVLTNPEERDDSYVDRLENDDYCEDYDYEDNIKEGGKHGNFQGSVSVPSAFFSYLVGSKGNTKRRIETETGTKLNIPSVGQEGDVVVSGRSKRNVSSAMRRIKLLVDNIRRKTQFTHFICFPVNFPELQAAFLEFKEKVLGKCSAADGINESLFQHPGKLHLTICTLVLMDQRERNIAAGILQECENEIVKPILRSKPLQVIVEGVECMNDDPTAVSVIYGKVKLADGSDRLQLLAQQISDRFTPSGLRSDQYERVKLHVTLMNTSFCSQLDDSTSLGKSKAPKTFNASCVLKEFADYHFAAVEISEVQISIRHSFAASKTGFYSSAATIKLNP